MSPRWSRHTPPADTLRETLALGEKRLTRWKTCSLRISLNRMFKSLTRLARSWSRVLSVLSIWFDSPITRSRINLMPPLWLFVDSQPGLPELDEAVKQILWSPASCAVKVNRPDEEPR